MENLNIIFTKTKASKINFKTANDLFEVHIDESYSPELELEDQSFLIFSNISQYFNLLLDQKSSNNINISLLESKYNKEIDDVADIYYRGRSVYEVEKYYSKNNEIIYRLKTF